MMGKLTSDAIELRKCSAHEYGRRFKSYRKGYLSGKTDGKRNHTKSITARAENPYTVPPDVLELLKKRARWEMGYEMGWNIVNQRHSPRDVPRTKKKARKIK